MLLLSLLFWPRSNEAVVAAFSCSDKLKWSITTGRTKNETYGGAIDSRECEYHRAELIKNGKRVFSVTNPTDCRDFKSWEDLYNGIDEPFYDIHQSFPAGHPIVAGVAIPEAVVPPGESFPDVTYQTGLQISLKSGLSVPEFVTASQCLLDHRDELQDRFGSLKDTNSLTWLALVDETAPYGPGDLPGAGQIFSCQNGYTYRTSGENLFALAPGEASQRDDEFGMQVMNDRQVAVIGFDGKLYEPDRSNSAIYVSMPRKDHRLVIDQELPAPFPTCVNDRGTTLADYFNGLKKNVVYKPRPEQYVPTVRSQEQDETSVAGVAPTPEQNADCVARYESVVSSIAETARDQGEISTALFYSPSLSMCVGVIQTVQGNVTNIWAFDIETRTELNATKTTKAFQEWSLAAPE